MTNVLTTMNDNVDIKISVDSACLENPSSGTLRIERLESQISLSCFGAIKTNGLSSIDKICKDKLSLR